MSIFTALNVEPDDNPQEDVDNAREIQIEEALKLYQAALKLHSQGPPFYDQAAAAYETLFKSEIFNYPESLTDLTRSFETFEPDVTFSSDLATSDHSTLPQILYLAYKNHGQFIIDRLRYIVRRGNEINDQDLLPVAKTALDQFSQALACDESDTELWRKAARIGAFLGSQRIARYCLEAAVEVDDDPTVSEVEPAALEEGLAGAQLKECLEALSDDVALSHPIMAPYKRRGMTGRLEKYMDPYPFLPKPALPIIKFVKSSRTVIDLPERSWQSLGNALLQAAEAAESGRTGIVINMPDDTEMVEVVESKAVIVGNQAPSLAEECAGPQNLPNGNRDDTPNQHSTEGNTDQDTSQTGRKRSQSTAGIQDQGDEENGAQKRSKRLRNKDSGTSEALGDPMSQFKDQLSDYSQGDEHMFNVIHTLLVKFGVDELSTLEDLQNSLTSTVLPSREDLTQNLAIRDCREIFSSWDETKSSIFVNGSGVDFLGMSSGSAKAGLATFLEHSKIDPMRSASQPSFLTSAGLASFVDVVNEGFLSIQDIVYEFVKAIRISYRQNVWSEAMKLMLIHLVTAFDAPLLRRFHHELECLREEDAILHDMTQMMFELRLDLYASITNPSSTVGYAVRVEQNESLSRWATIAMDSMQTAGQPDQELSLRYLWASVLLSSMSEGPSQEHLVSCWTDLQVLLLKSGDPKIELQNNMAMPEISSAAAEREISKLTTMDFFLNLFKAENSDPVNIIETLEPVLDPSALQTAFPPENSENVVTTPVQSENGASQMVQEMWKFLDGGNTSLRLVLWQRLREAYESIDYPTKVFSCHLRSIEMIVADLQTPAYIDSSPDFRQSTLLNWLKTLDDLLSKALALALKSKSVFEIIDEAHTKSTMAALARLCRLLHSTALFDDHIRVGMTQPPASAPTGSNGTFSSLLVRMREMQVRSWSLLYLVVKDGMSQNPELFPAPDNDLADYLAAVHYSLGLRKCCKASNKIFLKMMKSEMTGRLKNVERWEDILGQVLFDLYGLRLGAGLYELQDHECQAEKLEKDTTLAIADQVIILANRMAMKDLLKAELRPTIERMQQAVGIVRSSSQMLFNLRNYTEYLKTSLHPLRMYQALKGQVYIDSIPISANELPLGQNGWYFLLGNMALHKFRSQKRTGPGATDDLKVAATFFRLQLQFKAELWETWYRMAQCFDAELEEDVLWTADKLNGDRSTIIKMQRSSIHCYIMAVSIAMRSADSSFETAGKISDLYHDFGVRLYATSREPFGMEAFYLDDFEKHCSGAEGQGMYKKPAHTEFTRFKAWRYAAGLFKRALVDKPNFWMSHYMLGKCLWKMYTRVGEEADLTARRTRPMMSAVIDAFLKAIETVPKQKDNKSEPILEPHYKIMSIVHKLVRRGDLEPQAGANILQDQYYTIAKGEPTIVPDAGAWELFILESIRHLRNTDKANWHHRMIARTANIVFVDESYNSASEARTELRDSMFTKTMVVNVWKPDFERPGRHCVYMEHYVRFMIRLLIMLDDKANMEALAKRVRKKQADYYHFSEVWAELCTQYCWQIRRSGDLAPNEDDIVKSLPPEEFQAVATRLEQWSQDPAVSHPAFDTLKEAQELKKLNNNEMKSAILDDLIADAYGHLFLHVGLRLPRPSLPPLLTTHEEVRAQGPMSLNNLVSNMDSPVSVLPHVIEDVARPRPRAITRREILRRSEALVTRVPEPPRSIANAASRPKISDHVALIGMKGRISEGAVEHRKEELRGAEGEGESSAPGSVHDSADESDLSEIPYNTDGEDAVVIFPNLGKAEGTTASETGSTPAATGEA